MSGISISFTSLSVYKIIYAVTFVSKYVILSKVAAGCVPVNFWLEYFQGRCKMLQFVITQ